MMTFDDCEDGELLELYNQSASLLKEAIEKELESVISEYKIRHQAILAVCRSRGLVVLDVLDDDDDRGRQLPNSNAPS